MIKQDEMVMLHERLWNKIFTTLLLSGAMVDATHECMKGMSTYIGQEIFGMSQVMLELNQLPNGQEMILGSYFQIHSTILQTTSGSSGNFLTSTTRSKPTILDSDSLPLVI